MCVVFVCICVCGVCVLHDCVCGVCDCCMTVCVYVCGVCVCCTARLTLSLEGSGCRARCPGDVRVACPEALLWLMLGPHCSGGLGHRVGDPGRVLGAGGALM